MTDILLVGWQSGLQKVKLNKLLQEYCGMSLAGAKRAVDQLLAGKQIECQLSEAGLREEFLKKARSLGALVEDRSQDSTIARVPSAGVHG